MKVIKYDRVKAEILEQAVKQTEKYIDINIVNNLSQLIRMVTDYKNYINVVYQEKLIKRCELLGFNYKEVRQINGDSIYNRIKDYAYKDLKPILEYIRGLKHKIYYYKYKCQVLKYFNEDLTLKSNYRELIKQECTSYTDTENEDKLLPYILKLSEISKELKEKFNINWYDAREIINCYTNEIEVYKFRNVCK